MKRLMVMRLLKTVSIFAILLIATFACRGSNEAQDSENLALETASLTGDEVVLKWEYSGGWQLVESSYEITADGSVKATYSDIGKGNGIKNEVVEGTIDPSAVQKWLSTADQVDFTALKNGLKPPNSGVNDLGNTYLELPTKGVTITDSYLYHDDFEQPHPFLQSTYELRELARVAAPYPQHLAR